jgi:hypothetical protein
MKVDHITKGSIQGTSCFFIHRGAMVEVVRTSYPASVAPTPQEAAVLDVVEYAFALQEANKHSNNEGI